MPNGDQALELDNEGEDSTEESGEWESPDDDDEDESDESDDEEVVDSPPHAECRSKQHHDPASRRGKTHKRARSSTPEPTEKIVINPSKARKTLPKVKMDVPVASG